MDVVGLKRLEEQKKKQEKMLGCQAEGGREAQPLIGGNWRKEGSAPSVRVHGFISLPEDPKHSSKCRRTKFNLVLRSFYSDNKSFII